MRSVLRNEPEAMLRNRRVRGQTRRAEPSETSATVAGELVTSSEPHRMTPNMFVHVRVRPPYEMGVYNLGIMVSTEAVAPPTLAYIH